EDQLRAGERRQRLRLHDREARDDGPRAPRARRHRRALLRRRPPARAGRGRRLPGGRAPEPGRVRLRRPRGPEAAPLPEPLQARRGAALQLLHALPPVPLRGADVAGARGAVRRRGPGARRADARGGGGDGQARPQGRRGARRPGRVHDLRAVRDGRGDGAPLAAADRRRRGLPAQARRAQGPGAHLPRRRAAAGAPRRRAARPAGAPLRTGARGRRAGGRARRGRGGGEGMKAVILAGGFGTRLSEETTIKPKPMVEVGGRPILWHIMKIFEAGGVNEFVIALGYKGEVIKDYFLNFYAIHNDITVDLATGAATIHDGNQPQWKVHLVDTGPNTMTGGRLRRLKPWLTEGEPFYFTYGDGVADLDVRKLAAFHRSHGKVATVTTVRPPARFGNLTFDGD